MRRDAPLLVALGQALPNRVPALEELARRVPIEVLDLENDVPHGGGLVELPASVPQVAGRVRSIPGLVRSGRYGAVMIETQGPVSFPLTAWSAVSAGLPLIVWMGLWEVPRTLRWLAGRLVLERVIGAADAVITYGPRHMELARKLGASDIVSSVNPVDLEFWSAETARHDTEGLRFLFAGRLAPEKGVDTLLAAWERTRLAESGARLFLVGDGDRSLVDSAIPGVEMRSLAGREKLRSAYASSDVLVVPSITTRKFKEPWGLVVSEAMCQGVAVITSDAVGATASGLVEDMETGLVVPEGDTEALASAMRRLAEDRELRLRLSRAGRSRVADFGPSRWAGDVEATFERIVAA